MRSGYSSIRVLLSLLIILIFASNISAVGPSRDAIEKWKADGTYNQKMEIWKNFRLNGGCQPEKFTPISKEKRIDRLAAGTAAIDTVPVLVIMVDFADWPWTGNYAAGTAADFDSILFSDLENDVIINPSGSMTDFYMENSYGTF